MVKNKILDTLVEQLMKLPGVGQKTAERFAFSILKMPSDTAINIANAIVDAKEKLFFCKSCHNIASEACCSICMDETRDSQRILVVEEASTLYAIEKTGQYKGLYHVLHGTYSPLDHHEGHSAIEGLIERVSQRTQATEVILATSPNIDGEATALYLTRVIKPMGIKVTRIACGIPAGTDVAYADQVTLVKSLEGRREL